MQLSFKDKKVRELCERCAVAQKKLGAACARKLSSRLGDLEASHRVADLVAGNPHPLEGDRLGQFALNLAGGKRLVFTPDHDPWPKKDDGGIDWANVTSVCIDEIEDYHD